MSTDPRAQVRDMFAETLSGQLDLQRWAVEGWPTIADDLAGEVMGLFPEVWQHHTINGVCYVLRTAPTAERDAWAQANPGLGVTPMNGDTDARV